MLQLLKDLLLLLKLLGGELGLLLGLTCVVAESTSGEVASSLTLVLTLA